jgi:DNA-binding NarL/FixJ family response regulator
VARVMIVDDHPIVRDGLKTYLSLQADLEVIGEAGDAAEAIEVARATHPDLVLLDLRLASGSALALIPELKALRPPPRVVLLSSYLEAGVVDEAMRLGANGYLLKHVGPGTLVDGVRAALRGEVVLDPAAAALVGTAQPSPLAALSERERQVLACIVDGMTNKRAAQALGISEKTVKTHVSHLLAKLGVRDRTQAAVLGVQGRDVANRDDPPHT